MKKALLIVFVLACAFPFRAQLLQGEYRGVLRLHDNVELPFNFTVRKKLRKTGIEIRNAEERIPARNVRTRGDSLFFRLPVFDTEFRVRCQGDQWSGVFVNHYRKNERIIPFHAKRNETRRFTGEAASATNIEGKWRATFSPGSNGSSEAVAVFHHVEQTNLLSATFLTETGDYRYLEGQVSGDSLFLSAFDGSHAFLFLGRVRNDSVVSAMFYSGSHWQEPWTAWRDAGFALRDAEKITGVKDSSQKLAFAYRNAKGKTVSLEDKRYAGKPVIVQLMGSWCPNCMDESRYLAEVYKKYHPEGLEIIALAFEKSSDEKKARNQILRLKEDLRIPYEILITGAVGKDEASKSVPLLTGITAFPTTIFLNRSHKAVKVHTGFSGPATGKAYDEFQKETEIFIKKLLQ